MCPDAHTHREGSLPCLRSVFVSARQETPPGHSAVAPHVDEQAVSRVQLTIRRVCRGSLRGVCAPAHACRGAHFIVVIIGDRRSCDVALGGSLYSRACSCLSRRKDSILRVWSSPCLTGGQNASGEQGVDKEACEDL